MTDKYLTTGEVARLLNVSKKWCEYHRYKGDGIPFFKMGNRTIRYRLSAVLGWMEAQEKQNTCVILHGITTPNNGGRHASY